MLSAPNSVSSDRYTLPLMDMEIAHGDYRAVYQVAAWLYKNNGGLGGGLGVRASLAAAELGEVSPGQREFIVSVLQDRLSSDNDYVKSICVPGESPSIIAGLSHLALAIEYGQQHRFSEAIPQCRAALLMNPANPYLARGLSYDYCMTYQYSKAIEAAQLGLAKVAKSSIREILLSDIRDYQSDLRRFGDGHPVITSPGDYPPARFPPHNRTIRP